jgi:uncharacterized repeat protein (TIGR02059 family)
LRATVVAAVVAIACWAAPAAAADPGDIGYQDQSFAGFGVSVPPSGTKPESKLWFNDGIWWADMFDTVSKKFKIFRLDTATQTWTATSTVLDDRSNTMADVLWDGSKLYVASHVFQENGSTSGFPSRLYRFSYNPSTDAYSLDTGFPVQINDVKTETLVIDKDSTGQLWATWTAGTPKTVWVNRTACLATCDDAVWGTPFQLSTNTLLPDDISSLVAFGPPGDRRIGVMWSDQDVDDTMWFAVHADGDDDLTWSAPEAAVAGANAADDHINLKSDASGRVYAATKTSLTGSSPLTYLLVRPAGGAPWVQHVFGLGTDHHTRPIVALDETNSLVHMFATQSESGGTIYEKTLPMGVADANGVDFTPGLGTPRIRDASALRMNNSTSTKQPVSAATGLVVLAANKKTDVTPAITDYWHEYDPLTGGDTTPPVLGSAGVDGSELTLAYSEPLDETSVPSGAAFTVKVNTVARTVNLVSVYGPTVVLTLASPVIFGDTVTVGYAIPGASPLQDLAGNDAASFTNASATNATLAGSIATLHPTGDGTRDAVISANGGGTTNLFAGIDDGIATPDDDLTYVQNQSNSSGAYFAQLTDMPANFGSMSSVKLDLRARTVNRVDDTTTLYAQLFAADETTPLSDEVAVAVDPGLFNWATIGNVELTGVVPGTKAGWDGAKLRLRWAWTQVDTLDVSNHLRVTVVELRAGYVNAPDSTPPVLQDAHVNGSSLTLAYDEPLDTGSVPAASAFSATVNGGARGVSGVSVAGSVVTLTLTTPAAPGDTVTVSYTVPATSPVQDQAGNDAAGFAGRAVTNDTVGGGNAVTLLPNGDGTRGATIKTSSGATTNLFAAIDEGVATPDDASTYIQADKATSGSYFALLTDMPAQFAGMSSLTVDFRARTNNRTDDNLALLAQVFAADETTPLTNEVQLAVNPGTGGWVTVSGVALTGLVPASKAVWDGARLRLRWAYTQVGTVDTSIQLRLTAVELDGTFATGGDTTPPSLQSAHVNAASLTLAYDETLDASSVPAAASFTATVGGVGRSVSGVAVGGSVVTLTLSSPVAAGETVTVSYAVPGAGPLQDLAGNDAPAFTGVAVTNDTSGGGGTVTLTPLADAYVKSSAPGTNYGGATSLQLRDGSSDGSATARTYLKFDLSGISGTITSVKLRVFVTDAGTASGGVSATGNDFSGGGAWTEGALTWSNAPAPGSVLASLPTNALGTVEITLPASAFASGGPVFSLVLAAANTNSVFVTSKEGANPPQLVVATS